MAIWAIYGSTRPYVVGQVGHVQWRN